MIPSWESDLISNLPKQVAFLPILEGLCLGWYKDSDYLDWPYMKN
jgi:hypothetical protein